MSNVSRQIGLPVVLHSYDTFSCSVTLTWLSFIRFIIVFFLLESLMFCRFYLLCWIFTVSGIKLEAPIVV